MPCPRLADMIRILVTGVCALAAGEAAADPMVALDPNVPTADAVSTSGTGKLAVSQHLVTPLGEAVVYRLADPSTPVVLVITHHGATFASPTIHTEASNAMVGKYDATVSLDARLQPTTLDGKPAVGLAVVAVRHACTSTRITTGHAGADRCAATYRVDDLLVCGETAGGLACVARHDERCTTSIDAHGGFTSTCPAETVDLESVARLPEPCVAPTCRKVTHVQVGKRGGDVYAHADGDELLPMLELDGDNEAWLPPGWFPAVDETGAARGELEAHATPIPRGLAIDTSVRYGQRTRHEVFLCHADLSCHEVAVPPMCRINTIDADTAKLTCSETLTLRSPT
jgi:hypothetical protein